MFHKGWFAETLPLFDQPVDVGLLDVDLASATRTCLAALYPRLRSGGVLFSQDGHLQGSVAVMRDAAFWRGFGALAPLIEGLGQQKLLAIEAPP